MIATTAQRAWPQLLTGLRKVRRRLHVPGLDELSDDLEALVDHVLLELSAGDPHPHGR